MTFFDSLARCALAAVSALGLAGLLSCAPRSAHDEAHALVATHWHAPVALSVAESATCTAGGGHAHTRWCETFPLPADTAARFAALAARYAADFARDSAAQQAHVLALLELAARPDSAALDAAVALLQFAYASAPTDAALQTDLSAALLMRFAHRYTLRDLLEAVELLDGVPPEPAGYAPVHRARCLNRMIALAWVSARVAAREEGARCPGASWPNAHHVTLWADAVDTTALALNRRFAEFAFDHATLRLLPALAAAIRSADAVAETALRQELTRVQDTLVRYLNDSTVARTVQRLQTADARARTDLVRALELYGEVRAPRGGVSGRSALVLLDSIDRLTTAQDDVRDWAMLHRANLALTGTPRRPREALAMYAALRRRHADAGTVLGGRLSFNEAITRMALGDQVVALRLLMDQAVLCERPRRTDCTLSATTMGASLAELLGDDEAVERLLVLGVNGADGPLRTAHWTLQMALWGMAEREGLVRVAERLHGEASHTAAVLQQPAMQAEALVSRAHLRTRREDTVALRVALDELTTLVSTTLSPADSQYYAAERQWLDGAWRLATGRAGARVRLDSAVMALASDSNSARTARPLQLRARAIAAAGDTGAALEAYDELLRRLRAHAGEGATLFERDRVQTVGAESGVEAARLLLARGEDAAAVRALDGVPFRGSVWPARVADRTRLELVVRRLHADTVLVWSRHGDGAWMRHAARLPTMLTARAREALADADLEAVHAALLAPVLRDVPEHVRTVRVDARGDVAALPWAALRDEASGRPLVARWALSFTDDLWRDAAPLAPLRDPRVLVVDAAPRAGRLVLYGSHEEAVQVAETWGARAQVLSGAQGGNAVLSAWRAADVVHFTGHAILDARRPERSALALPTGALSAQVFGEVPRLETRLVVLAACDTRGEPRARRAGGDGVHAGALARAETGDALRRGLVSLANALQAAGAQEVIGALWPIDDAATRAFMVDLHRALHAGATAAEALQAAQVASFTSDDPARRTPRVWAAFQLLGR